MPSRCSKRSLAAGIHARPPEANTGRFGYCGDRAMVFHGRRVGHSTCCCLLRIQITRVGHLGWCSKLLVSRCFSCHVSSLPGTAIYHNSCRLWMVQVTVHRIATAWILLMALQQFVVGFRRLLVWVYHRAQGVQVPSLGIKGRLCPSLTHSWPNKPACRHQTR